MLIKSEGNKTGEDKHRLRDILSRAEALEIMDLKDVSYLLSIEDHSLWQEIFRVARCVKEKVYGKRIVLFAPLYLSNECINNCLYCGFRRDNRLAKRKTLSVEEAVDEALILSNRGYKRILLVAGEHPRACSVDYLIEVTDEIYRKTDIRIIHLNAAPMDTKEFKRLKDAGIGVYQCFQETYHRNSYRTLHPSGPKSDYDYRFGVMDRAIEGGFRDIGMGVLLGLYDWKWDVYALLEHCHELIRRYGFGPHTLSVPRLQPAEGAVYEAGEYAVSDEELKRIVAIYRLALPYVGVVVSTREPAALRDELLMMGVSQISAGSKTNPGGYSEKHDTEQFKLTDNRSLDEIVEKIASLGLLPSFCTACYREGRVGEVFRRIAESESMNKFCRANALLSLKEYIRDYAGDKEVIVELLNRELSEIGDNILEKIEEIEHGESDIHI